MLKGSKIGEKSDVYRTIIAGGIAGAIEGSIVMAPSELVKVMLINHPEYSVWKCVSEIYSQRGFFGFYKGMTSTVMRHTINQASSLSMYEWLYPQTKVKIAGPSEDPAVTKALYSGASVCSRRYRIAKLFILQLQMFGNIKMKTKTWPYIIKAQ